MCKFKLPQKEESTALSPDPLKAYSGGEELEVQGIQAHPTKF